MPAEPDDDRDPAPSPAGRVAAALDALRTGWGIEFAPARSVLTALAGGRPLAVADLVEGAGLARRHVLDILRALDVFVQGNHPVALEPEVAAAVADWLARAVPTGGRRVDQWDELVARSRELVDQLSDVAARLPPSRWHLDHVPATPATMAKRALYLTSTFALDGAHLLCVGDHDLTSLAVTLAEPRARATVVDVDERLLAMIDGSARELGLDVTCARADLRLGLPASLAGSADLAFTDPPYTPAGIELFVRRGLEGLRRPAARSRVLFCYGFGDRTASRAVEIQDLMTRLGLAFEAVHPDFNAYRGAEAIGGRSHLYVARPTRTTWPAVDRRRHRQPARIYTRGREAEERGETALSEQALTALQRTLDGTALTLVGGGWPDAGLGTGPVRRLSLDQYVTGERRPSGAVAVNLFPEFGAALVPALLAAPSQLALVVGTEAWQASGLDRPDAPSGTVLRAAFELTVVLAGDQGTPTVVQALRLGEPPDGPVPALHRYLVAHPTAKVVNAWREGLVHVAAARGVDLTKNQARHAVAETGPAGGCERLRLGELPLHLLGDLAQRSAHSVRAVLGDIEPN